MAVDSQTLHGVDDLLSKLKSLPPEIVSKRGGPVKSALRKGGLVIQKAAQAELAAIVQKPDEDGYVSTGTLSKAVVVRRDPRPQQSGANERYRVLIARRRYPDGTRTVATARYLEFGTEYRPPTPFMTPAYFRTRQEALDVVVSDLSKSTDRIVKKLSL